MYLASYYIHIKHGWKTLRLNGFPVKNISSLQIESENKVLPDYFSTFVPFYVSMKICSEVHSIAPNIIFEDNHDLS